MYSPWKISNHPNSQTSLQKLLGKSFVPCHITHIYQDTVQPLHSRVYQIICSHNGRKGTHYDRADFVGAAAEQYSGRGSNPKANYGEHKTEFSGALAEWMALS